MRCGDLGPSRTVWKASSGNRLHLHGSCKKLRRASKVRESVAHVEFDDHRVCAHCANQTDIGAFADGLSGIDDL